MALKMDLKAILFLINCYNLMQIATQQQQGTRIVNRIRTNKV